MSTKSSLTFHILFSSPEYTILTLDIFLLFGRKQLVSLCSFTNGAGDFTNGAGLFMNTWDARGQKTNVCCCRVALSTLCSISLKCLFSIPQNKRRIIKRILLVQKQIFLSFHFVWLGIIKIFYEFCLSLFFWCVVMSAGPGPLPRRNT